MASAYNSAMQAAMEWLNPFEYHPQRGLYWHEVASMPGARSLLCGTQPRSPEEVEALAAAGVTTIISLQTDSDMQHWGVNISDVQRRCAELGIKHVRKAVSQALTETGCVCAAVRGRISNRDQDCSA